MSTENDKATAEDSPVADVERIRDIIFGPQMRQYEQRFQRMAKRLELMSKQWEETRTGLDQRQTEQGAQARELKQDLRRRHTELSQALSSQVGQLESTFGQQGAQMQDEVRQSLDNLRQSLDELRDGLSARLERQGQDLRSEFTSTLDTLEEDKANRHDLGDLLVEMGMRLKEQGGIADLLGQLEQAAEDQPAEDQPAD